MSISNLRPLTAVGREYIREINPNISDNILDHLTLILDQYIMNLVSFEYAKKSFDNNIGNIIPLQKIFSILNQCSISSNSIESKYLQAQALTNISNKKMRQWTEIEDQRLLSGIHKFGTDNWALVASHLGNTRSRAQCSQRWFRGLDPKILKASWTEEEENLLVQLVQQYGDHRWTKIANNLGNRSDAQCRYHYYQLLKEKQGIKLRKRIKVTQSLSAQPSILNSIPIISNDPEKITRISNSGPLPSIENLLNSITKSNSNYKNFSTFNSLQ